MMTEARLPNWWIHHMCIVEIWFIWVVGNIGEMGKGRIIENQSLCKVVRVDLRVFLHIAGQMTCTPAIVWIAQIKILRDSQKTKLEDFRLFDIIMSEENAC